MADWKKIGMVAIAVILIAVGAIMMMASGGTLAPVGTPIALIGVGLAGGMV